MEKGKREKESAFKVHHTRGVFTQYPCPKWQSFKNCRAEKESNWTNLSHCLPTAKNVRKAPSRNLSETVVANTSSEKSIDLYASSLICILHAGGGGGGGDFHMWADGDVPFFRVLFGDSVLDLWVYFQRPRRINGYPLKTTPDFWTPKGSCHNVLIILRMPQCRNV